jgi:hypothetical protein
MQKRGAIEMSISTIIIIVLAVAMLIFGMIFIRSIMCSGIVISEQVSTNVQNQIRGLFGANDFGVLCMGEKGEQIKIADGGRRPIVCVFRTEDGGKYNVTLKEIKSASGVPTANVQAWVIDSGFNGNVKVGEDTQTVALLNIPQNTPATTIKLTFEITGPNGAPETHNSLIDVTHVGAFTSAIC